MCDPRTLSSRCRLRPARTEDIQSLSRVNDESGLSRWSPGEYQTLVARPEVDCLVAEEDGEVVGFCLGLRSGPEVELLKIAVGPTLRRSGIGSALLARFLEASARAGCEACFLEVREGNLRAQELYRRFGFKTCGRRRAYYSGPIEDALLMRLDIGSIGNAGG